MHFDHTSITRSLLLHSYKYTVDIYDFLACFSWIFNIRSYLFFSFFLHFEVLIDRRTTLKLPRANIIVSWQVFSFFSSVDFIIPMQREYHITTSANTETRKQSEALKNGYQFYFYLLLKRFRTVIDGEWKRAGKSSERLIWYVWNKRAVKTNLTRGMFVCTSIL